jgi:hypothetical protein
MNFFRRRKVMHSNSGRHLLNICEDSMHVVEEHENGVWIDGKQFSRREAIDHFRNLEAACRYIAAQIKRKEG